MITKWLIRLMIGRIITMYLSTVFIQLDKYTIRIPEEQPDVLELKPNGPGLPEFKICAKDAQSTEFIRQAWLKDISEMQEHDGMLFYWSPCKNNFFINLI